MPDTRIALRELEVDDPSEQIPDSVTFTAEGKTAYGGFGRIGDGYIWQAIQAAPPGAPPANYGYTA